MKKILNYECASIFFTDKLDENEILQWLAKLFYNLNVDRLVAKIDLGSQVL